MLLMSRLHWRSRHIFSSLTVSFIHACLEIRCTTGNEVITITHAACTTINRAISIDEPGIGPESDRVGPYNFGLVEDSISCRTRRTTWRGVNAAIVLGRAMTESELFGLLL